MIHLPDDHLAEPIGQESVEVSPNVTRHRDTVCGYVDEVLSGHLLTGRLEQAACQRYLDDVRDCDAKGFRVDENLASVVIDWFATLRHTQGEFHGQPFVLHPVQAFLVWNLFGWVWCETGLRRFGNVFYSVARGNGKSPVSGAIGLRLTAFDIPFYPRATSYMAATTAKQARIAFDDAGHFVRTSGLQDYIQVQKNVIRVVEHDCTLEPLAAVGGATSGLRIKFLGKDELHAYKETMREFYNELSTGLGKFPQSLDFTTTTAGDEESVIWREEYEHCKLVVSRGNQYEDDTTFVLICEIDDEDQETVANLPKANPLMRHGVISEDFLKKEVEKNQYSPTGRAKLRRYRFNKLTESAHRSITDEMWRAGGGEMPDLSGICPTFGVDFGVTDDFSALGYCFELEPIGDDRRFAVEVDCFATDGTSVPLHKEPFATWVKNGYINVTEKKTTDMSAIYGSMEDRMARHGIQSGNCDGYAAFIFAQQIQERFGIEVENFKQSMEHYCEPLRQFKSALVDGRLFHGDNPVLGWAAGNLKEKSDEFDRAMPTKKRSTGKIDPFIAVLMAFARCLLSEPEIDSYAEVAR